MTVYIVLWDNGRKVRAFSTRQLRNDYIAKFLLGKSLVTMETVLVEE